MTKQNIDLTNKNTKRVKVACNFSSFYEALTEMQKIGGEFKYEESIGLTTTYLTDSYLFFSDDNLADLQRNYTKLYRYEEKQVTVKDAIEDFIENSKNGYVNLWYADLEDYLINYPDDEVFQKEFVEACKIVVAYAES